MTRRRIQSWASSLLLVLSLGLFALVAVLYFRGDDKPSEPIAPTPIPGENKAIDVLNALLSQDLDASFGPQELNVRSRLLEGAGQALVLGQGTAYIFFYADQSTQEDALLDVAATDVDIQDIRGDPIDVGEAQLYANSNVAVLLVHGSDEEAEKVAEAVASLE